jgi:dUTP pyrophosphatase
MPTTKKKSVYKRGDSRHYVALARASAQSRIKRHIEAEVIRDPQRVTTYPARKRTTDAGYDVSTPTAFSLKPGETHRQPLGVRVNCPPGYFYQLAARSGLSALGVDVVANVIDATYTGELEVLLVNHGKQTHRFEVGHRIAQLLFFPQLHVTFKPVASFTLVEGGRGAQGWASSGH